MVNIFEFQAISKELVFYWRYPSNLLKIVKLKFPHLLADLTWKSQKVHLSVLFWKWKSTRMLCTAYSVWEIMDPPLWWMHWALLSLTMLSNLLNEHFSNAILLFIDTSNNAWYYKALWLIGTSYLAIIASNEANVCQSSSLGPWYQSHVLTDKM